MRARRCWIVLVSMVLSIAFQPQFGSAQCCQPATQAAPAAGTRMPRIDAGALKELRLPDVTIESAVQHDAVKDPRNPDQPSAAHIEVDGIIGQTIRFELLLPMAWNGRFVMGGGGGFVGTVQNAARSTVNAGYATVGTDTGHQSPSGIKAQWALDNVEARVNFGYLAVHRTAEVAKALIHAFYGEDPAYSYFMGCSRGGGQALMEAQRYPDDFDGIVSGAPAFHWSGLAAAMVYNAQHLYPDPQQLQKGLFSVDELKRLETEILDRCDELDGLKDGILDDPRECEFDVTQLEWLSDQQKKALRAIYEGPHVGDRRIYPGMPLGAEGHPGGWLPWITGPAPTLLREEGVPSLGFSFGTEVFKNFAFNDPDWDYATYDFSTWEQDTHLLATYLNATDPDLSRLNAAGGKLILWHGWSDAALTALASIEYFEQAERRDPKVRDYFRLYMLPGVMHCAGGPGPDQVDWLAVIVKWVEQGEAPERLVASRRDANGNVDMTRPLYPYPQRAKYSGRGSSNEAENFTLPDEN